MGRLLDTLDRTGLADNTLLVFTSDVRRASLLRLLCVYVLLSPLPASRRTWALLRALPSLLALPLCASACHPRFSPFPSAPQPPLHHHSIRYHDSPDFLISFGRKSGERAARTLTALCIAQNRHVESVHQPNPRITKSPDPGWSGECFGPGARSTGTCSAARASAASTSHGTSRSVCLSSFGCHRHTRPPPLPTAGRFRCCECS